MRRASRLFSLRTGLRPASGVLLALVATATAELGAQQFVVRDSSGVRITESRAPLRGGALGWSVGAEPVARIGRLDGPAELQFSEVLQAIALDDGSVLVVDGGTRDIRHFGPDGSFLRTIGRRGQGPGEFSAAPLVAAGSGDTLVVAWDRHPRRLTWFDPGGRVLREESLAAALTARRVIRLRERQIAGDGTLVQVLRRETDAGRGVRRSLETAVAITALGTQVDTVTTYPTWESRDGSVISVSDGLTVRGIITNPFAPAGTVALDPRGSVVWVAHPERRELRAHPVDGSGPRIVRIGLARTPVTSRLVEEVLREYTRTDPAREGEYRSGWRTMEFPDSVPAIRPNALHIDPLGYLWVARRTHRGAWARPITFDIVDPAGRWIGVVTMPASIERIFFIGEDRVLVAAYDEFEVPYVDVYPLDRGGPAGPATPARLGNGPPR